MRHPMQIFGQQQTVAVDVNDPPFGGCIFGYFLQVRIKQWFTTDEVNFGTVLY